MKNPWTAYWARIRARRDSWRPVLEAEVKKWSAMSYDQVISRLNDEQCYELQFRGGTYQVEVAMLEKTETYIHVGVSVDDGSLPASLQPVASSFIIRTDGAAPLHSGSG